MEDQCGKYHWFTSKKMIHNWVDKFYNHLRSTFVCCGEMMATRPRPYIAILKQHILGGFFGFFFIIPKGGCFAMFCHVLRMRSSGNRASNRKKWLVSVSVLVWRGDV